MSIFDRWFGKRDAEGAEAAPAAQPTEPSAAAGSEQGGEETGSKDPVRLPASPPPGDPPRPDPAAAGTPVDLPLPALVARLRASIPALEHKTVDLVLVQARLADRFRDAGHEPLHPQIFEIFSGGLDEDALRRLALLVGALDDPAVAIHLPALFGARDAITTVQEGFLHLASRSELLTMELLRKSRLRVEELARAFIAALGAGVEGEALEVSLDRLARLDYARLLSEAEQAKLGAVARVAYLKRLQDEHAAKRPRRGKW